MKRVLVVAYVFPPEPSAGALRPGYLARYLPLFGWEATVLTRTAAPPPFPSHAVHCDARFAALADRLPFRLRDAMFIPDAAMAWIPCALRCGLRLMREQHYDAILGTALPASVHVVSALLARFSGLPWIADYRDPWTGNPYLQRGNLRARIELLLERSLLWRADAITTISDDVSARVAIALGRRDIATIPNAYDPCDWDTVSCAGRKTFELVYTGSMHDGKRRADLLFEALANLHRQHDPAAHALVHFYGPGTGSVLDSARRFGVEHQVEVHGTVPRHEAMRVQRSAAATLIFLSMESSPEAEMGSKFLEYLGARRPMIAFVPPASRLARFLEQHELGWPASNAAQAQAAIRSAYAHFVNGSPDIEVHQDEFPTAQNLARRFAEQLDALTARRPSLLTGFNLDTARGELRCR